MKTTELEQLLDLDKRKMGTSKAIPTMVRTRLDDLYRDFENGEVHSPGGQAKSLFRRMRKTAIALTATAALGLVLVGSAFFSPVMAESLKQIPIVGGVFKIAGDFGLQQAEDKGYIQQGSNRIQHKDVKLKITQVIYDGIRLVIAVEREGGDPNVSLDEQMKNFDFTVDGKKMEPAAFSYMISPTHHNQNSLISISKQTDKYQKIDVTLPDSFKLNLQVNLTGIEEPFNLEAPVHKVPVPHTVWKPNVSKASKYIRFTVDKIDLSPVTTQIFTTASQLKLSESTTYAYTNGLEINSLNYTVFDDQGNELKEINGTWGRNGTKDLKRPATRQTSLTPFPNTPKFITIKPYLLPSHGNGSFYDDGNGDFIRVYLPELEVTIPVEQK
ncbi:DUF4179 domain-containing protein [Paenibacillus pini]|uniref:DUF4179 domain-containing protein n=1 Tax=Paenibacillus pini JCM 16418 TaxID=1236976 RepID=W7YL82_9BACL|nr:DUF4179 domain-containing protein [Paenibacillus pini]GAF08518.1 hypothetical protein JCM16418_2600 [Paenibacillus pini JCM 16418]